MNEVVSQPSERKTVHARAAMGGLVGGISFALTLGLNLIQVPLLLRFWPQETYGLWISVGALSTFLTTLDGGHQLYVGNLLTRYYVEDREAFHRTLASAIRIASLTSAAQIILAIVFCFSGQAANWLGIESKYSTDFAVAVVIYTIGWISVGSVGSILVRLFPPTGFFVRSMWWTMGTKIAQFVAIVAAAWLGWGLVGTTLLFAGTVFVVNLLLFYDIWRLYPELFPWWKGGDLRYGLGNFSRSSIVTIVSILDLISLQGVILLVTSGLGAAVVPLFTTIRTFANTAMQGTGFLLNPVQPDLVRYHVQRDVAKLCAVFSFFWLATCIVINGGLVAGLFVVEPLYHLWTRGKLEFDRALFAWLSAAVLVRTLAAPMQNYISVINHLRALLITAIVRASLTVSGVLILAPIWKLSGVGAGLFFAELFGSLVLPWWFTHKTMEAFGGRIEKFAPRIAALSSFLACTALVGFAFGAWFWPGLALVVLVAMALLAILQWRSLLPEVRMRVLSVGGPLWRGSRGIVATR